MPDPDTLSAFAAQDSRTGAVTVMVISKILSGSRKLSLDLANFAPSGRVSAYQLTSANTIQRLPELGLTGTTLRTTVPAQSITLFVVPKKKG